MLVKILAGAAAALILVAFFVGTRPAAYHVERKLEIAAPAERVFAVLTDLGQFSGVVVLFGSPLEKGTVDGSTYAWKGNDSAGRITIDTRVPNQKVAMKLEFDEPMESKATWNLAIAGSSTTWSIDGNHNFLGKIAGLFMDMDKALGTDLELSLAKLKAVAEAK